MKLFVQYDARCHFEYEIGTPIQTASSEDEARALGADQPDGCWWEFDVTAAPEEDLNPMELEGGIRRADLDLPDPDDRRTRTETLL